MKINTGVDLVEIKRIKKILSPNIFSKIFTKKEQEYFKTKKMSLETIAGCFAAKEALLKSLNEGLDFCKMTDIEILHTSTGSPYYSFHNTIKKKVKNINFSLSISHEKEYWIAFVVAIFP